MSISTDAFFPQFGGRLWAKWKSKMISFKSTENIHKKEDGSYYVVSANKTSSVTLFKSLWTGSVAMEILSARITNYWTQTIKSSEKPTVQVSIYASSLSRDTVVIEQGTISVS